MQKSASRQASRRTCRIRIKSLLPFVLSAAAISRVAIATESEDLSGLSLLELGNVQVTSVSKSPELLRQAPAAIYVITQDDIQRSGATSLAEALRLAPNLALTQMGSSDYTLSARGFSGRPDAQNFSNKLLMLIDGRSVYSPLFSGIYMDSQDVLLGDISRIEVISGPGATLWGANAMNGVINVITRPAYLTRGATVTAIAGNLEQGLSARYGAQAGDDGAFRVYAKAFERDPMSIDRDTRAEDGWQRAQAGFRLDLNRRTGSATVQGDYYSGSNERVGAGDQSISGANLLGRWEGRGEHSEFHIQGYFDHVRREAPADGSTYQVNTFDLELQQASQLGARHRLVWGAGGRSSHYDIDNTATLLFLPPERTLQLWNIFAQDTMTLGPTLKLTVGLKLEHNSLSDWEPQPDVRLAWQASDSVMLWTAASHAVRTPTPFDVDVQEILGGVNFLVGNPDFESEKVTALEAGIRTSITPGFSLSLSTFYNRYTDLRTVEVSDTPSFLPLTWGNRMAGHSYGINAWARWQLTDRWRLEPGIALLRKKLHFTAGSSELIGTGQAGNDPRLRAQLNSSVDLWRDQTLDLLLRHVSKLPDPALPAYTELSARYAWQVTRDWQVSLRGTNLLHARHREYPLPAGILIKRGVFAEVRWRH